MKLAGLKDNVPVARDSTERLADGVLKGEQSKGIAQTYNTSNFMASDLAIISRMSLTLPNTWTSLGS